MADDRVSWLKRWILHNWEMKAMALFLALITWYAVRDAISFEQTIPAIRIEIQVKEGMAILEQSDERVEITVRGSHNDLQRLDAKRIQAVVDLRSRGAATVELVTIGPQNIEGVRGVSVIDINPPRIHVALDREEERRLPVVGKVVGTPLAGVVAEVSCEPATVWLHGPAQKLRVTEVVYTQPVDVDGRVASFVKRASVLSPGENWTANPPDVQVRVTIVEQATKREWPNLPIVAVLEPQAASKVQIEPSRATVILAGAPEELKAIGGDDLRVFVDCGGLKAGTTQELPLQVFFPRKGGITATTEPAKALVSILEK